MTGLYVASNPTALGAQFNLTNNMGELSTTLTRLSTGLRINSGKDDPAGLIASELLKSDITGTTAAITNTQRANSMIATADSALGQVSNLLNDIKGLVVEAANDGAMSADQIRANQLQINASVDAIDRIAKSTTYAGKKLLDGSMDFSTSGVTANGTSSTLGVSNVSITSANFGSADKIAVNVDVQETAKRGTLIYNGTGVDQKTTIDITGSSGTETFNFGAKTTTAQMAEQINARSDSTGVQARVEGQASRGTAILDSAGANNGILITANEEGYDNGNYTFRIVKGETDDAKIVSDPTSSKPGVVEITLGQSYAASHKNFAGMFNISIAGDANTQTSVSIQSGASNKATYSQNATNASGTSQDSQKTLQVTSAGTNGSMSSLNGWTVVYGGTQATVNDAVAAATKDEASKTITVYGSATGDADTQTAIGKSLGMITGASTDTTAAAGDVSTVAITNIAQLAAGDSFKLSGGSSANELVVTYKEGATAADILKLINANTGVQATLATGVNGTDLIKNVVQNPSTSSATTVADPYTSNRTANDVINLINSKLGDKFTANLMTGDSGAGMVGFMDAAASYGSVNTDNAIRFTGMDHGPVVRMVTTNADGTAIKNQKLSVSLINPTDADIAAGRTTPILQINLATDAGGNSITTAKDIIDLFNTLTPEQTGGVSASLIYPDGVDPNGRTWVDDGCGGGNWVDGCGVTYGLGIVKPTGEVGPCEIQENDIVLLGANQALVKNEAIGRVPSTVLPPATANIAATASGTFIANGAEVALDLSDAAIEAAGSLINGMQIEIVSAGAGTSGLTVNGNKLVFGIANGDTLSQVATLAAAAVTGDLGDLYTALGIAGTDADSVAKQGLVLDAVNALKVDPNTATGAQIAAAQTVTLGGGVTEGEPLTSAASVGNVTGAADSIVITTNTHTSALNGVAFNFTTDASKAGFDETTGALTIYLSSETQALVTSGAVGDAETTAFEEALTKAINGAIHSNWQGIQNYTKTTSGPVSVTVSGTGSAAPTTIAGLLNSFGVGNEDLRLPPTTQAGTANDQPAAGWTYSRGVGSADPALLIEAKSKGPEMAGTKLVFMQDDSLAAATDGQAEIRTVYNEKTKTLEVYANASALVGGIKANVLADSLNADATFNKYFTATPTINIDTSDADQADTVARVAFNTDISPSATMTGGYKVSTDENLNNINTDTAISSGIGMFGNNDDNQRLVLEAVDVGSQNFVKVSVVQGDFRTFCPLGLETSYLEGTDMVATINGLSANADGNNISIDTTNLALSLTVDNEVGSSSFDITGGGAIFQLGPNVVSSQQMRIGIGSMLSSQLGGSSGTLYQLKTGNEADVTKGEQSRVLADKIVNEAINYVANTRGRLGAVQKSSLEPNIAVLQDSLVALTEAEANISNADFAEESSNLTRLQLLIQAGASTLAIANQLPQYAASLVR